MQDIIIVRCYAEGHDGQWEAFCLDLDLAVQGESLIEVQDSLNDAMCGYLEYVSTLPARDRKRLMNRKAPLSLRLRFLALVIRSFFSKPDNDTPNIAGFNMPCKA